MITTKDLNKELNILEKVCLDTKDEYDRALLKSNILAIKLLHNVRANQVLALRSNDVSLIQSGNHE